MKIRFWIIGFLLALAAHASPVLAGEGGSTGTTGSDRLINAMALIPDRIEVKLRRPWPELWRRQWGDTVIGTRRYFGGFIAGNAYAYYTEPTITFVKSHFGPERGGGVSIKLDARGNLAAGERTRKTLDTSTAIAYSERSSVQTYGVMMVDVNHRRSKEYFTFVLNPPALRSAWVTGELVTDSDFGDELSEPPRDQVLHIFWNQERISAQTLLSRIHDIGQTLFNQVDFEEMESVMQVRVFNLFAAALNFGGNDLLYLDVPFERLAAEELKTLALSAEGAVNPDGSCNREGFSRLVASLRQWHQHGLCSRKSRIEGVLKTSLNSRSCDAGFTALSRDVMSRVLLYCSDAGDYRNILQEFSLMPQASQMTEEPK